MEKDLEPSPSPPNCSKGYWKLLPLLLSISWPSLVTSWVVLQKIYSKMYLASCSNTYHDVTDSVNHGMVKNTKHWISWERNIIFIWNKRILNLCLRWNILRNYHFVMEVNFNNEQDSLNFWNGLHKKHPNIKFTIEKQVHLSIPFLDALIIKI